MHDAVRTQWIEIAPGYAGYLALPPGGAGSSPGLLLLQEIFGVNAHIRAVAEQYALDGFTVLAPDLFWRTAPRVALGYEGDERAGALQLMQGYGEADALADLGAAAAALRARPECATRVGAVGYCMGGRMAFMAAAVAGLDAAVAYYGGGLPAQMHRAGQLKGPMLFHYAGLDDHIPPAARDAVREALGERAEIHVYDGAQHGFNCWARASHHPAAAALAHGRTLQFLARHLF